MTMMKFLLLTFLVISPISIFADKDLMVKECHNTQVPAICMQCLESDTTSVSANPVGIAGIVIKCLDSRLKNITNNITDILSSKEDKGDVKRALEACKKDLSTEATTKLSEAKTGLKTGDYDKAGLSIKLALGFPLINQSQQNTLKQTEDSLVIHKTKSKMKLGLYKEKSTIESKPQIRQVTVAAVPAKEDRTDAEKRKGCLKRVKCSTEALTLRNTFEPLQACVA